ncbi:MAG: hypothetical protein Q8R53_00745 [Nanoarchaeota archaeon]|nr:hypothetical protein [Nanoarchaeota archaeon]
MDDIHFPKPLLHLFVCINDRAGMPDNSKPSCGPRITADDVKEIKRWIVQKGWAGLVYCTKVKCLGFCNSGASVAVLYPKGRFVKYHTPQELQQMIEEEVHQLMPQ